MADVRRPETLRDAVATSSVVVSAMHGFIGPRGTSPHTVDDLGNRALFDAAAAAGADVVMMSVVGAAADSPFELFAAKFAAEQHLRGLDVPWTIVRSTAFLETWVDIIRDTAGRSGRPVVFGPGANPINFALVEDVASRRGLGWSKTPRRADRSSRSADRRTSPSPSSPLESRPPMAVRSRRDTSRRPCFGCSRPRWVGCNPSWVARCEPRWPWNART